MLWLYQENGTIASEITYAHICMYIYIHPHTQKKAPTLRVLSFGFKHERNIGDYSGPCSTPLAAT